jgi:hypothetical protein
MSISKKERKLLDEVRDVMWLYHYSIHTERTYCDWIKRYIQYHNMTCREEIMMLIKRYSSNIKSRSNLHANIIALVKQREMLRL